MKMRLLPWKFDVHQAVRELDEHPEVWNVHNTRRYSYGPHQALSDVWVRYNHIDNLKDGPKFVEEHESVWYPEAQKLPAIRRLVFQMMAAVEGERLGGVLITKIPAGCNCDPHIDRGWHATYYEKYAIQLASTPDQAFHFEGESLSAAPGESYTFDNSFTHWVTNPSSEDRMTLIICIRTARN